MLIRYNALKIELIAMDAKPGGLIGAMLSPYLFSVNMSDFCKKFNDQSKDYETNIYLSVNLWCDINERTYTFKIKILMIARFLLYFLFINKKLTIINFYDLILYYNKIYKLSLYSITLMILSILHAINYYKFKIKLSSFFYIKLKKFLKKKVV